LDAGAGMGVWGKGQQSLAPPSDGETLWNFLCPVRVNLQWNILMHGKRTFSRPGFYFVVVLTSVAPLFGQAAAASTPVLTVCEALRDLKLYNGKDVVIVGRSGWTFEGTFLSEDCEPDGRTMVQGNRWLTAIYISAEDEQSRRQNAFPFDEELLRQKLAVVQRTTHLTSEQKSIPKSNPFADRWVAILGRLVSPGTLLPHRPPKGSQTKNVPGNGFGANGSVPAELILRATYKLN